MAGALVQDPTLTLTAADRCDRCGAQAYVRARLASGGELLFCAHHFREHGPKVEAIPGVLVHNEVERLTKENDSYKTPEG